MKKKRQAGRKITKKRPRKSARRKAPARPSLTAQAAGRSITLEGWLAEVKADAEAAAAEGSPTGACLVLNPQTGTYDCIQTDEASCARLNGTFIGGPC